MIVHVNKVSQSRTLHLDLQLPVSTLTPGVFECSAVLLDLQLEFRKLRKGVIVNVELPCQFGIRHMLLQNLTHHKGNSIGQALLGVSLHLDCHG